MKALYRYLMEGATRGLVWRSSFFSVINKLFDIMPEVLIGIAIDVIIKKEQSFLASLGIVDLYHQLYWLGFFTFLIWVLESITEYLADIGWRNLAQKTQHRLRMDAVENLQHLPLRWFETRNSGEMLSVLGEDVNQVERFLNGGLHQIIQIVVSTVFIGAIFFYISKTVALLAFLPIPIILLGARFFRHQLAERYGDVRNKAGNLGALTSGVITGLVTIRAAVAETFQLQKVRDMSLAYAAANQKAIKMSSAVIPLIRMAVLSGFLFTMIIGGMATIDGTMEASAYTVLVFLTQRLLWPFTRLGEVFDLYERTMASAKRVLAVVCEPRDTMDEGVALPTPIKGDLIFKDVSFGYSEDRPKNTIQSCSFAIKAGQFIGITGPTGSGKSTIVKLILKFYEPGSGTIFLDDDSYNGINAKSLRRQIGYVSQDVYLLDDSIENNLKLSYPDATEGELITACKLAEIHDFIESLPAKYQTRVGERGVRLSGGQRQRLAMARGLLRNPRILILDEATSAVDNETEASIQRSLEKAAIGRTMIVIAHRLSAIRRADNILVFEQGRIIQSGTHDTLVATEGLYRKYWQMQLGAGEVRS